MFNSDLGVFSKDKIDYGSKLLLETFLKNTKQSNLKILDMGCGYGFIGIVISKVLNTSVDMCDVNLRAINLCENNIKQNNVKAFALESDAYQNISNKYDIIITNPPIKVGKKITLKILLDAKKFLEKNGTLWFVMRKDHGAKSIIKTLENDYLCQVIEKSKGFYIILCKNR